MSQTNAAPQWFTGALAQPYGSHYIEHQGRRLHYLHWQDDSADAATKPVLVFIHGFRGHARWWGFAAPHFVNKYRVYALDFSGMGDSDDAPSYGPDTHCDEILAFIETLNLSDVSIVAHSFGGARSFRAAGKKPQLFKHIIAIDSYVGFNGGFAGADPAPQRGGRTYAKFEDGLSRFRLLPPQPHVVDYVFDYIAQHSLKPVNEGWTWKFDPSLVVEPILLNDGEINLPLLQCQVDYIYGSESSVITAERAKKIKSYLAKPGRFIKIENGHHHIMASHPEALIQTLQELL